MNQNNNIPDASESWVQAGKMLDRHFRRRRIIGWLIFLLVPAAIGIATFVFSGKAGNNAGNVSPENNLTGNISNAISETAASGKGETAPRSNANPISNSH